jgi:hypothetical protein
MQIKEKTEKKRSDRQALVDIRSETIDKKMKLEENTLNNRAKKS